MTLRKAELKDKQEVLDTVNLLSLPIPGFVWNKEEFVEEQIRKGEYFLQEENGVVIGVMSLRKRTHKVNIETLVVKTEFQSKGYGTKFIDFACQYAKEHGFTILHAYSFNEYNMVDFYLKRGFTMLDQSGSYHNHPYYCFEKKV
ncbi:GNAT family N-acetyltransferase [Candidatus Parcubacteria bacterium]|nr:GNAT family N-acetyltransferase [Candidatus Parcubacteria bacterium]